jgi:PBSX family phage portal protein
VTVDVQKAAAEVAESTEEMVQITILKADVPTAKPDEDSFDSFLLEHGGVAPPYDPETMITIFENSDGLYPNVSAYQTNIDSFGHDFEPLIDPDADGAEDLVFNALFLESAEGGGKPKAPDPEAVEERLATLRDEIAIERFRADAFFEMCCADESFVELRRRTRMDLETTGNAYWEIIRDKKGRPSQFVMAPTRTMRLTRQQSKFVEVEEFARTSPLKRAPQTRKRRFRRFIQVTHSAHGREGLASFAHTYFKEYGDPRVLSATTGRYFESVEEMRSEENEGEDAVEANEILHFKIPFPGTAYGVPRWVGNLLAVLGNRQAGEVNFAYFDNKTVPPLALIVSGGRITQSAKDAIQTFLREEIKGRQNFHKVLIIEGVPAQAAGAQPANQHDGQMKIDLKPLTDAQQKDGLFLKYDERNLDKMGMSFRLPRLLRGDVRDFNRATANAALEFADTQVFGPERDAFDWIINRRIMIPAGFGLVRFVSRGVQTRDPATIAEIMEKLAKTGGLVPADVRRLSTMVLGVDLPDIDERWTTRPVTLSTSGGGAGVGAVSDPLLSEEEAEEAGEELGVEPAEPKPTEEGNEERGESIEEEDRDREGNSQTGAKKRKRKERRRPYRARINDALVARKLARIHGILLDAERERAAKARAEGKPDPDVELAGIRLEDFVTAAEE